LTVCSGLAVIVNVYAMLILRLCIRYSTVAKQSACIATPYPYLFLPLLSGMGIPVLTLTLLT